MTKVITPVVHDEVEKVVASLSIKEKKDFVNLIPVKGFDLVPLETIVRQKFVIQTIIAQGITQSWRWYTPKELSLGGQKKDQGKRSISEGEAEEFLGKM